MRKMDFLGYLEAIAVADPRRSGGPFADTVHGEHGRIVERRGIKRRGRMAQMMLAEQQPTLVEIAGEFPELVAQQVLLKQFLAQPERDRHLERAKSARRHRDIGFQQPLEFEERLVIEHDMVEAV